MTLDSETKLKETLHITRHWHNPEIRVAIHKEGIELEVSLENFCLALADEIGSPTWMIKRAALKDKLMASVQTVLSKVKEASAHV